MLLTHILGVLGASLMVVGNVYNISTINRENKVRYVNNYSIQFNDILLSNLDSSVDENWESWRFYNINLGDYYDASYNLVTSYLFGGDTGDSPLVVAYPTDFSYYNYIDVINAYRSNTFDVDGEYNLLVYTYCYTIDGYSSIFNIPIFFDFTPFSISTYQFYKGNSTGKYCNLLDVNQANHNFSNYSPIFPFTENDDLYITTLGYGKYQDILYQYQDLSCSFNFNFNDSVYYQYADGYQDGYDDGFFDGKSAGNVEGYDSGYGVGFSDGDNAGYLRGYADGTATHPLEINFLRLLGAIADTPVYLIRQWFDFEFFGINALSVLMTLLTASIVLYFIRKFL